MFLICGEVLFDVFVEEQPNRIVNPLKLRAVAGGSPLNVAIGLARLGCQVALGSDVAADTLGARLVERLEHEGIDQRFLRRSVERTPLALVSVGPGGSPSYSFYGLSSGTFAANTAAEDPLSDVRALHLGSIALVLSKSEGTLFDLACKLADRAIVSLDPNVRLSIEPDRERWIRAIERTRPLASIVKVSDEDLTALYGEGLDCDQLCRDWLSGRTKLVVLTKGSRGATFYSAQVGRLDVRPDPIEVVDTVGAGDSFMAVLLAKLVSGDEDRPVDEWDAEFLEEVGRFAATAAALTCSSAGPTFPTRDQVERPRQRKKH